MFVHFSSRQSPSLSELKSTRPLRELEWCTQIFFLFGLAIGNFCFSPLLTLQQVLSVHTTGRTDAAGINLWKDIHAHWYTVLSQSFLKEVYVPWIRPTPSNAAKITLVCFLPMISVCWVGLKSHESLVLPLAATQTLVQDLCCLNM